MGVLLVRPGQGGRRGQDADRPGRRYHHAAHRLAGADPGGREPRRVGDRPGVEHERVRAQVASDGDHRQLVALLCRADQGGARWHLGDRRHLGRFQVGHGADGAL